MYLFQNCVSLFTEQTAGIGVKGGVEQTKNGFGSYKIMTNIEH